MAQPSIKKNFAYKSILTLSNYLMNFVTFPYVSRVLGVERIGLVGFVDNTVNYFLLFATMGVGLLGVREIASVKENKLQRSQVFSNILGLNLVFTLATLFVYLLCVTLIPKLNQYEELFYIGTAKILFTAFLIEWFFTGVENFRYITIRSMFIKLLYVIAVFIFIKDTDDYRLYFILTVGVVVINALINMIYVRRFIQFNFRGIRLRQYIKPNITLGIYALMTSMYLTFNVMFLGLVSNNIQVGYYTTAHKLYMVVLGFFSAFTNVMLPRMSSLLANGEKERFQELINKSFTAMATFSIPMIICSIILAPQIIYILSGPGYEGAILPMRIIMPAALFVGIAQVLAVQILMPMKRDKILLTASIIGASISLLINITIVYHLQSIGSAIVLLCSEMAVTCTYMIYVWREKLAKIPVREIWKSLGYSVPSAVVCWGCGLLVENSFGVLFLCGIVSVLYYSILKYRMFSK